jgi:hypothetical protein
MQNAGMRRADRALSEADEIAGVISAAVIAHVGFVDNDEPYVVPLNFGWDPGAAGAPDRFWFHSAPAGRKAILLAERPRVCVQLEADLQLVTHPETACAWTQAYRSVIAWGTARIAVDHAESRHGLDAIMRHHTGRDGWTYPDRILAQTLVWCVEVARLTAKAHPVKEYGG